MFTFGLFSQSLDRKGTTSDDEMQLEVRVRQNVSNSVVKFNCIFCFVCSFPIFLLIILWALFTFFDFGVDFLCFLVYVLNLVNQGFWVLEVLFCDLLALSDFEFGCVLLPEKSRYCSEVVFEFRWALSALAILPSWLVITGLSCVIEYFSFTVFNYRRNCSIGYIIGYITILIKGIRCKNWFVTCVTEYVNFTVFKYRRNCSIGYIIGYITILV